jgi:hypothetical protein
MSSYSLLTRIRYRLRYWHWRLLGGVFALKPLGQLDSLSSSSNTWRATGRDPRFACITDRYPLRAGWYKFSIDLEILDDERLQPMLYFDFGHGMHEAWSLDLNFIRLGSNHHEGVVLLQRDVHDMRFDPTDAPCTFRVSKLGMKPLTRAAAAWLMLKALRSRRVEAGNGYAGKLVLESASTHGGKRQGLLTKNGWTYTTRSIRLSRQVPACSYRFLCLHTTRLKSGFDSAWTVSSLSPTQNGSCVLPMMHRLNRMCAKYLKHMLRAILAFVSFGEIATVMCRPRQTVRWRWPVAVI